MMAKLITEKRKANVGERILITDSHITLGDYKDGEVFTVKGYFTDDAVMTDKVGLPCIFHKEYEVIVESKPSKSERISLLESQVAELSAKIEAMEFTLAATSKIAKPKYTLSELLATYPTPNEQRKAVIERAKAFVTEHTKRNGVAYDYHGVSFGKDVCNVQFIVNTEKRAVTLLAKGVNSGKVRAKAIAKCAPDDVFNADIGKAIALGRALGLDVSEFENAVKPTKVVVGMRVTNEETSYWGTGRVDRIEREGCEGSRGYWVPDGSYNYLHSVIIIDDTEAQY